MATTTSTQKSTIVSVFDSYTDAQAAVRDLTDAGVPREDISLVANDKEGTYSSELSGSGGSSHHEGSGMGSKVAGGAAIGGIGGLLLGLGALAIPGIGPIIAAGPIAAALGGAAIGAAGGGIVGALKDVGVPDEDASFYSEHVRRGGTLLTVQADSSMHDHIHSILERHDPVSVDDRMEEFRSSGWSAPDPSSASYVNQTSTPVTQTSAPTTRSNYTAERVQGGEQSIPVVEEQMVVGKREVQRGGVRLYTRVVERPVQEEVTVRDETIRIDRRKVDRPVDPSSLNETEKVLEIVEVDEEPVVGKTARVIEEVVVGKDVTQRTEPFATRSAGAMSKWISSGQPTTTPTSAAISRRALPT